MTSKGHIPRLKRKRDGYIRGSLRLAKTSRVGSCQPQDKSPGDYSYSAGISSPVPRPSSPSSGMSVSSSSRASTPFDDANLQSTADRHTSISMFPQGERMFVRQRLFGYKSAEALETTGDEDYNDGPCEDWPWVDEVPKSESRPAKRSCAPDKAADVSLHFELSCPSIDYISNHPKPLEDLVRIRDTLLIELCRHEGLRGLDAEPSGFPLCGGCGESSGTLRCTECSIDAIFCPGCMCTRHREQPLHRIQVRCCAPDQTLI
jgi:hypothetical protein